MKLLHDPQAFQAEMLALRARGLKIALVPTMGALHLGHEALIAEARARADVVVVSIFVNPLQFGPREDFASYPRDLTGDSEKARAAGATHVFAPEARQFYPEGFQTQVEVGEISEGFCGASRPGHFRGVATVVLKLLVLAGPHWALFGEKDYQQLLVIKRMVHDLALPVSIVAVPTVREADGLAMSSRNAYLSAAERRDALVLKRALDAIAQEIAKGERRRHALVAIGARTVSEVPAAKLVYVDVVDAETLVARHDIHSPSRALIAAYVGNTRLIDNRQVL